MNATRIKIYFSQGIIEAEGSEAFVKDIYEDIIKKINSEVNLAYMEPEAQDEKSGPAEDVCLTKGKINWKPGYMKKITGADSGAVLAPEEDEKTLKVFLTKGGINWKP